VSPETLIPNFIYDRLDDARKYTGELNQQFEILETKLGQVAVCTIADELKPRPNEDAAAVLPAGDDMLVLIVADGVGGAAAAREASNKTIETIESKISGADPDKEHLRALILDGIEAANQKLLALSNGAATTLAAAEIHGGTFRTYHVGDSAIWLCGQRGLVKLQTTMHSPVGMALEAGFLEEDEALQHEELNLISNVVGSFDMSIEIGSPIKMAPRDTLLLASDGLFDNLLQDEIIDIIRSGPLDQAGEKLATLALHRMRSDDPNLPGKPDDFTLILFRPGPAKTGRR